jgi:hypothetical protein
MSRRSIPLAARVRYEGRVQTFDRRAKRGADLEKLPNPVWRMVSLTLRTHFRKIAKVEATKAGSPAESK